MEIPSKCRFLVKVVSVGLPKSLWRGGISVNGSQIREGIDCKYRNRSISPASRKSAGRITYNLLAAAGLPGLLVIVSLLASGCGGGSSTSTIGPSTAPCAVTNGTAPNPGLTVRNSATCPGLPQYDRSGPWWSKVQRPIFGMAYTAEPSDYDNTSSGKNSNCAPPCKYFDSDFTNADFSLLWGPSGRNDLDTIRKLKVNFITLYDWVGGFCRNHKPFLDAAWNGGTNPLMVTVPFADSKVQNVDENDIRSIIYEVYGLDSGGNGTPALNPAAAMWRIGNEAEGHGIPLANVARVAQIILDFETAKNIPDSDKLLITSDVDFGKPFPSFPPGIHQIIALQQAFTDAGLVDFWHTRFIASVNPFNPGTPDISDFVKEFPQESDFSLGDGLALFFAEYGQNSKDACGIINSTKHENLDCSNLSDQNKAQAEYLQDQFQVGTDLATARGTKFFYGFSVFQWQDAFWKCPAEYGGGRPNGCTESLFGVQTVGAKTMDGSIVNTNCGLNAATYPVNTLDHTPAYGSISIPPP
jgi:hypothetical protein